MASDQVNTVQFFFDPVSPYVWLASKQLNRLIAAGLQIDCQPILFAALLNAHGQKGPAEIEAKRRYVFADVLREVQRQGYAFKGPPTHPFNPLRALRMCIALDEPDERLLFSKAILSACWEQGRDLADANVLDAIAKECGYAQRQLSKLTEEAEIKNKLMAATSAAIAAGVFGVPTFQFNDELFWGGDRIDALLWRVTHPVVNEGVLEDFLLRQASARRTN